MINFPTNVKFPCPKLLLVDQPTDNDDDNDNDNDDDDNSNNRQFMIRFVLIHKHHAVAMSVSN